MASTKSKEARAAATAARESASSQTASSKSAPVQHAPALTEQDLKHFVLDTNVLLHNPNAPFVFKEHHVIIPFAVIEELDKLKRSNDDVGRNARECIRHLDRLRSQGRLIDGVKWGEHSPVAGQAASSTGQTGDVRIDVAEHTRPSVLAEDSPDNRIIAVAWALHSAGKRTVFVSKDLNARIKSDALGIRTEDFENQKVDAERLYTGFLSATLEGALIDELYAERMLAVERVKDSLKFTDEQGVVTEQPVVSNQFIILRDSTDEGHTGLARRLADTDHLIPVNQPRKPIYGILPRNVGQTMAMDLLMDDEVRLVTLLGSAGTGKTLLAVAAGMAKTFNEERYEKLLVARPIMPLGRDIGYLPGDKDEKLAAWMQPIFDNLTYLMSARGTSMQMGGSGASDSQSSEMKIRKLMADGKLVLEPLTYIRGRSIPHQFMIVDEAQNLTPHEIKTIVSRVGEGTKVILTGDIQQIDNPYLDQSSNGLSYLIEKMKGLSVVGHVTLTKSERSELASLAAELL
ncbi:MAG TPA: PhoH family protein [Phycisphaerales bacterium]|jgi:PhoH-like ATPase|nr:PhoH family protein [Phycisphaerales bacterium]